MTCCALMAAGSTFAAPVLLPNGDFEAGNSLWSEDFGDGIYVYQYPATGGNPNGYGIIDNTGGGGPGSYGIWVANGTAVIPLGDLGLNGVGDAELGNQSHEMARSKRQRILLEAIDLI